MFFTSHLVDYYILDCTECASCQLYLLGMYQSAGTSGQSFQVGLLRLLNVPCVSQRDLRAVLCSGDMLNGFHQVRLLKLLCIEKDGSLSWTGSCAINYSVANKALDESGPEGPEHG